MQYSEIINDGTLVYKSQPKDSKLREWSVKETVCAVRFYKTEPLTNAQFIRIDRSERNGFARGRKCTFKAWIQDQDLQYHQL